MANLSTSGAYGGPLFMYGRALTLSNGDNHDVALGAMGFQLISGPTAGFAITGIAGGTDGKVVVLLNRTAQAMTLKHEDAGSVAANRIATFNASNAAAKGAILIYNATDSRWYYLSDAQS